MSDKKTYGLKPDLKDFRDKLFIPAIRKLPPIVDLRPKCSPVENQGNLSSCTAHAVVGCTEYLLKKNNQPFWDQSRLFIYYNTRVIQGDMSDNGASLRDTIKAFAKYGVCDEKLFPYNESKVKTKPSQPCYDNAAPHKIITYLSISTIDQMKLCLADGYPFVGGISIYPSFETAEVARTGVVPLPKSGERLQGGHAVCFVGYDDTKQCFIVRNSWSDRWGIKGYFYLPYVYVQRLCHDCWTIRREL